MKTDTPHQAATLFFTAGFNTIQMHPAQESWNTPGFSQASQRFHREEVSPTQVHALSMGMEWQLCAAESSPHGQSPCQNPLFQLWVLRALSFILSINELYYLTPFKTAFKRLKHWLNMKKRLHQHWHSRILMHFHNCMQQFTAGTELWWQMRIKQQRKTPGSVIWKTRPEQA